MRVIVLAVILLGLGMSVVRLAAGAVLAHGLWDRMLLRVMEQLHSEYWRSLGNKVRNVVVTLALDHGTPWGHRRKYCAITLHWWEFCSNGLWNRAKALYAFRPYRLRFHAKEYATWILDVIMEA